MTKFYSIEYVDNEGELVVKQAFLSDEQKEILLEEFRTRGGLISFNDLSSVQNTLNSNVTLNDEN